MECTRRLTKALPWPVGRDRKIMKGKEPIRLQDSLTCPQKKNKSLYVPQIQHILTSVLRKQWFIKCWLLIVWRKLLMIWLFFSPLKPLMTLELLNLISLGLNKIACTAIDCSQFTYVDNFLYNSFYSCIHTHRYVGNMLWLYQIVCFFFMQHIFFDFPPNLPTNNWIFLNSHVRR